MRRRADRRDNNEPEIRAYIERCGCSVEAISQGGVPDLLIGVPVVPPVNLLMEIKGETGTLTPHQEAFFARWAGQKAIVRTRSDAKKVLKQYMPTRVYKCEECGIYERKESFKTEPLTECVTCGKLVKQVYKSPQIIFRGNGWGGKNDSQT